MLNLTAPPRPPVAWTHLRRVQRPLAFAFSQFLTKCWMFFISANALYVIYFGGKIALNNHFYSVCITFDYLLRFATKTYAKSHSAPQTPSWIGHAYGMCKGLQPLLFPNSLLNAGCFSFLANALWD